MKKLILAFLLFSCELSREPIREYNKEVEKKADFNIAYNYLRSFEGNYGLELYDPGGETYAGIARNYNKKWKGWLILDNYKKNNIVKKYDSIPLLEFPAFDYYQNVWYSEGYDMIRSQKIANYLFDYRNSGPIAYIHVRRVLVSMGYVIDPNGTMDGRMIFLLNICNEDKLIENLKHTRMKYYIRCVRYYPKQVIFLEGWFNRTMGII